MGRIRVAKSGGTIDDNPKDLVLDSNNTHLMIYDEQTLNSSATSYTHNLGYYPLVFAYFQDGSNWHPDNSFVAAYSRVYQDTNNVYIENNTGSNVKLFICGNAVDNASGSGKNTAIGKIKIAKSGFDADTETDIRRFQFCSGLDLVKRDSALSGTVTLTSDSGLFYEGETFITHDLGYVPMASVIDYAGFTGLGGELPLNFADGLNSYYFYMTSTRMYFGVSIFSKDPVIDTYTFKYQIYRNKIA